MPEPFLVHHDIVTATNASPNRLMLVLHGILGSGGNFRSFVRRLAAARPEWGFVLVDLRAHGQSTEAPPPHSIETAALDLIALENVLKLPVKGALGHSFGGKVALAYAELRSAPLDQLWVLDSQPGARPDELRSVRTSEVVRMLEDMPAQFPSRERFVEIIEERGHNRTFAAWLAMNLKRDGETYRLRVDMTVIRKLFESYYQQDLWHVFENPQKIGKLTMVVGGKSEVIGPLERERLAAIQKEQPHVVVAILPEAGHWVHVDDPEGLFKVVSEGLQT